MILIKNGRLIDPASGIDRICDLVIDGQLISISGKVPQNRQFEQVIDASGCIVAPGLIDIHVHFRDPGFLYKENVETGAKAAAKGGFTTVVCMANTKPPIDNSETLSYVLTKGAETGINILACANVTKGMAGQELTDMMALKAAGAAGFTDDGSPLMNGELLRRAMETARQLDLPISLHEEDPSFIKGNGIHLTSPAVAEDSMVARDCMIALHTGADVNIQHISSRYTVEMIRYFKSLGARIWAEVTPHHFTLTETAVTTHGTLAKMNPPLRTEQDRLALINGLQDGTIDIIATDHAPHSQTEKNQLLEQAPSGIIGLETALALGITELVEKGLLTYSQLIEKMSLNPARLYRLNQGTVQAGRPADLVIFNPDEIFIVTGFESKSANSPFLNRQLKGKVKYTICNGKIVYEDKPHE